VVRTLYMQAVLGALLWKMYPSMLPGEIIEAIDCDLYDDTWWLVRTEVNAKSKAEPPRTLLHLIDTQQGLDASGPPKPRAGGNPQPEDYNGPEFAEPPATCSPGQHTGPITLRGEALDKFFECEACGERVG